MSGWGIMAVPTMSKNIQRLQGDFQAAFVANNRAYLFLEFRLWTNKGPVAEAGPQGT